MPYGVKANVKAVHRFLRLGALCWVVLPNPGNAGEKLNVLGMSRGGRKVCCWVSAIDLENFRPGWFMETSTSKVIPFHSKEVADDWCNYMNETYGNRPVRHHALQFDHREVSV
jgi:hypothetical protein